MARTITFKGNPLTLTGRLLEPGDPAPNFKVVSQDLKDVELLDFKGKIKLLASFPSLDTPVCDMQVRQFNERAAKLSKDIVVIGISKDLPFAQKRFCQEHEIKNSIVLSDYKHRSFGINYGMLIKELGLLARGVFIIDKNDTLRYTQLVSELTASINYDEALKNLEDVIKTPALVRGEEPAAKCKPCEGGMAALSKDKIDALLIKCPGWEIIDGKKITKVYKFKDFQDAKNFVDLVSVVAEEEGHHPTLALAWGSVRVNLTTHAAGGLTDNDFIMARMIDELGA